MLFVENQSMDRLMNKVNDFCAQIEDSIDSLVNDSEEVSRSIDSMERIILKYFSTSNNLFTNNGVSQTNQYGRSKYTTGF